MDDLQGKAAVITGAASGIGLGLAQRFGAEGMRLVLADIEPDALGQAADGLRSAGIEVVTQVTDVSDGDQVDELGRVALDAFGAVHLVCNNAGVGGGGLINTLTTADWQWVLGVNLWGVIHGIQAFVPAMLAGGDDGHVVNTSSGNGGIAPLISTAIYATTKAAVTTLSEVLWGQLRSVDSRIGVSVLYPGPKVLRTGLLESASKRPARWQNDTPRTTPFTTIASLSLIHI